MTAFAFHVHAVFARGGVKSAKRNVFLSLVCIISIPHNHVDKVYKAVGVLISVDQMGESNFRIELEEVWVPKDVGELEGLLLTIQNEPSKKILKHKIQQILEERDRSIAGNWEDHYREWCDYRVAIG